MRLLWITEIPPRHRMDSNELGSSGELTVHFERSGAIARDNSAAGICAPRIEGFMDIGPLLLCRLGGGSPLLADLKRRRDESAVFTDFSSRTGNRVHVGRNVEPCHGNVSERYLQSLESAPSRTNSQE